MTRPIEAEGLVRHFGDVVAVDGVDLVVDEGEIFGFLGPNGAGKSTIVRMLTTLLKPTAGRARVAGHDVVEEAGAVRRAIGVALQDAAIDPLMTGPRAGAAPGRAPRHLAGRTPTGAATCCSSGSASSGAANRRVGTYSGGMRRRLDLALSLVHEPSVLFLDEPTTGLDPTSRTALWEEVRRLNAEGTTVFLTTQYLEEADELAGRVAIIDNGRIVREGSRQALKASIGADTLVVTVGADHEVRAAEVLARFGSSRAAKTGSVAIGIDGGAGRALRRAARPRGRRHRGGARRARRPEPRRRVRRRHRPPARGRRGRRRSARGGRVTTTAVARRATARSASARARRWPRPPGLARRSIRGTRPRSPRCGCPDCCSRCSSRR